MQRFLGILLSLIATSLPVYQSGTCIVDPKDPFEPNARMQVGPRKGECIDPRLRRSVKILNSDSVVQYFNAPPKDDFLYLANFSHGGRFWLAEIPLSFENVYLQNEYFPVGKMPVIGTTVFVTHPELRFDFSKGKAARLIPQPSSQTDAVPGELFLNELVLSFENIGPDGTAFDLLKGLQENYALAYRLVSLQDKIDWMLKEQKHRVTQDRLAWSSSEASLVLSLATTRGSDAGYGNIYDSLRDNCLTEMLDVVDVALQTKKWFKTPFTNFSVRAFRVRGMIDEKASTPTLNEELGFPLPKED